MIILVYAEIQSNCISMVHWKEKKKDGLVRFVVIFVMYTNMYISVASLNAAEVFFLFS